MTSLNRFSFPLLIQDSGSHPEEKFHPEEKVSQTLFTTRFITNQMTISRYVITKQGIRNQTSMPPKKEIDRKLPSVRVTSSGRTIKPRIELETYSSLEEDSSSDSDSSIITSSTRSTTSRSMARKGGGKRKRNLSSTSSVTTTTCKEYLDKRARNNDAVRRSRERRREKERQAQSTLESLSKSKQALLDMDTQLMEEMELLRKILDRKFEDPTINLSAFLDPKAVAKFVKQPACKQED